MLYFLGIFTEGEGKRYDIHRNLEDTEVLKAPKFRLKSIENVEIRVVNLEME